MATQLFFQSTAPDWSRGQGDADQQGTTQNWSPLALATTRGGAAVSATRTSIAGSVTGLTAGTNLEWISGPLDADTTISGTVTFNLWGNQAANANNTGLGCIVQRLDSQGAVISTIVDNPEIGIELPNTTPAVRNETATPTSTNMLKGDRLRIRVYFNDAVGVTMGSGGALVFRYAGTTAAVNGDSYVSFTENFGFLTAFTPSALITQNTSTASDSISGGSGTNEEKAQGFNLATPTNISAVDVWLDKLGTPSDNVVLNVVSTLDGSALASQTVAASSVSTTAAYVRFTFSTPVSFTSGDYFLELSRSGARDTTNRCTWYRTGTGTNPYTEGSYWTKDSGTWAESVTGFDFRFIIYAQSTLYLTNTAAEVDPNGGSFDAKEAWTSRGAGVQSATTSDVAGPTVPIQATASAGGNALEWFTKQLTAFTLDGLIACNIRALEVNAASNAAVRCEVAVTAADGTSPVVWGAANDGAELGTSEAAMTWFVAGDATAVTDGQRLRIRVHFDDAPGVAMGASSDMTLYWAGTTAAASGDTYITLPQTVTEYAPSGDEDVTPTTVASTTAVPALTTTADGNLTTVEVVGTTTVHGATVTIAVDVELTPTTVAGLAAISATTVTADADVTTTTVAALAEVPTISVVVTVPDADVTPTTVIGIATVEAPSVVGNANAPPNDVAAIAAIPTPSIAQDSVITVTTVVAVSAVLAPSVSGDANLTTTTVAAAASIDTPTVDTAAGADVSLATVAAITAVPALTVAGNADATPITVLAITAVPAAAVTADANITLPTMVTAQAAVPAAAIAANADVTPASVAGVTTVPIPSVEAIQNASVTPTTVLSQASVDTPSISIGGDAALTLGTVISSAAVDTPTVSADANVTTITITSQATVPGATVSLAADAEVTPSTIAGIAAVPSITVSATQNPTITLSTVTATTSIETSSVVAGGNIAITTTTVPAQAAIPGASVAIDVEITAGNIQAQASISSPSTSADVEVALQTIVLQAEIPPPNAFIGEAAQPVEDPNAEWAVLEGMTELVGTEGRASMNGTEGQAESVDQEARAVLV